MKNNSSQESSDDHSFYLELPQEFSIFRLGLQIVIAVLGVAGNLVVITKIIRGTKAFSVMTPYLLSLSFADLGILLFCYPIVIFTIEFQGPWVLGRLVCLYIVPFGETFFGACIWSIAAIAAERYLKVAWQITLPISHRGRRPSKRIVLIVLSIWLGSFLVAALPPYLYVKYYDNDKYKLCPIEYPPSLRCKLTTVNAIFLFVLPLGVISFSYQRISKLVGERAVKLQDQTPNASLETSRATMKRNTDAILVQTKKTQRILKPLVILFTVTMLPYQLFLLTMVYWEDLPSQSYYFILMTVVSLTIATNSAADPLVYCIMNREFRREIQAALNLSFGSKLITWRLSFRGTFSKMSRKRSGTMTNESYIQAHDVTPL